MLVKWFRVLPARYLQSPRVCRLKIHETSTVTLCHLLEPRGNLLPLHVTSLHWLSSWTLMVLVVLTLLTMGSSAAR